MVLFALMTYDMTYDKHVKIGIEIFNDIVKK